VLEPRVLVVDDKDTMRSLFVRLLGDRYRVDTAADGHEAIQRVMAADYDLVVTDIRMPGADGFVVLEAVKAQSPDTEVVMMTGYGSVERAVEAIKKGAYDYIQKPFDPDEVTRVIERALERRQLRSQKAQLERTLQGLYGFDRLVGRSPAMREVYGLLERAAGLEITVLLVGETGTGKELAARAIHHQGRRQEGPFVPINCGAIPAELIESELFGHKKGAFTGAGEAKVGLFEEASGGTLFLDEIGELPLPVQVKLNRALQERELRRVGENQARSFDARIIAATHRDLLAEVKAGRFREDLYYRLNVFQVRLPALRERREDLSLLSRYFLDKHNTTHGRSIRGFEPAALRALLDHLWPGNVRQLENALERAVAVADGDEIRLQDLPADLRAEGGAQAGHTVSPDLPYKEALERIREQGSVAYLRAVLQKAGGNVTRAAELAGIERESLHRLLRKHGLRAEDFKSG
jgi:DNA-binding NtrC family response regulator